MASQQVSPEFWRALLYAWNHILIKELRPYFLTPPELWNEERQRSIAGLRGSLIAMRR
jgi:hypothetical protein